MPEKQQNYVRRNWFQVRHAHAVYAVGRIRRWAGGMKPATALGGVATSLGRGCRTSRGCKPAGTLGFALQQDFSSTLTCVPSAFRRRRREESGLGMDCVAGGTQWAVAMVAQRRLPVFVFDDEVSGQVCCQLLGRLLWNGSS